MDWENNEEDKYINIRNELSISTEALRLADFTHCPFIINIDKDGENSSYVKLSELTDSKYRVSQKK